jgi:hypothetical protein
MAMAGTILLQRIVNDDILRLPSRKSVAPCSGSALAYGAAAARRSARRGTSSSA